MSKIIITFTVFFIIGFSPAPGIGSVDYSKVFFDKSQFGAGVFEIT